MLPPPPGRLLYLLGATQGPPNPIPFQGLAVVGSILSPTKPALDLRICGGSGVLS